MFKSKRPKTPALATIPPNIEPVRQKDMDRLLLKQFQARVELCACPFRALLNTAWRRAYHRQLLDECAGRAVLPFVAPVSTK